MRRAEGALGSQRHAGGRLQGELARGDDAACDHTVAVQAARTDGDAALRLHEAVVDQVAGGVDGDGLCKRHLALVMDVPGVSTQLGLPEPLAVAAEDEVLRGVQVGIAGHIQLSAEADAACAAFGRQPRLGHQRAGDGDIALRLQGQWRAGLHGPAETDACGRAGHVAPGELGIARHADPLLAGQAKVAQRCQRAADVDGSGIGLQGHALVHAQFLRHGDALACHGIEPASHAKGCAIALAGAALHASVLQHQRVALNGDLATGTGVQAAAERSAAADANVTTGHQAGGALHGQRLIDPVVAADRGAVAAAGLQAAQMHIAASLNGRGRIAAGIGGSAADDVGRGDVAASGQVQGAGGGDVAAHADLARGGGGGDAAGNEVAGDAQVVLRLHHGTAGGLHGLQAGAGRHHPEVAAGPQVLGLQFRAGLDRQAALRREVAGDVDLLGAVEFERAARSDGSAHVDAATGSDADITVGNHVGQAGHAASGGLQPHRALGLHSAGQRDAEARNLHATARLHFALEHGEALRRQRQVAAGGHRACQHDVALARCDVEVAARAGLLQIDAALAADGDALVGLHGRGRDAARARVELNAAGRAHIAAELHAVPGGDAHRAAGNAAGDGHVAGVDGDAPASQARTRVEVAAGRPLLSGARNRGARQADVAPGRCADAPAHGDVRGGGNALARRDMGVAHHADRRSEGYACAGMQAEVSADADGVAEPDAAGARQRRAAADTDGALGGHGTAHVQVEVAGDVQASARLAQLHVAARHVHGTGVDVAAQADAGCVHVQHLADLGRARHFDGAPARDRQVAADGCLSRSAHAVCRDVGAFVHLQPSGERRGIACPQVQVVAHQRRAVQAGGPCAVDRQITRHRKAPVLPDVLSLDGGGPGHLDHALPAAQQQCPGRAGVQVAAHQKFVVDGHVARAALQLNIALHAHRAVELRPGSAVGLQLVRGDFARNGDAPRAVQLDIARGRNTRGLQIARASHGHVFLVGEHGATQIHTHPRIRGDDADLPCGHGAQSRRIDGDAALPQRSGRGGQCRACILAGIRIALPPGRELDAGDAAVEVMRAQRPVDEQRLADQIQLAHRAFDARSQNIDLAASHGKARQRCLREGAGRTVGVPPLHGARAEREMRRVDDPAPVAGDAVGVGDDDAGRIAEYFHRTADAARRAGHGHLIDDGVGRAARSKIRVGRRLPTQKRCAAHQAVVEDDARRRHIEPLELVQRNTRCVGGGDVHQRRAALQHLNPRLKGQRGPRIGDGNGVEGPGRRYLCMGRRNAYRPLPARPHAGLQLQGGEEGKHATGCVAGPSGRAVARCIRRIALGTLWCCRALCVFRVFAHESPRPAHRFQNW
nr:hypothetical protein [Acidovorax sp. SUPP3334]